jgi:hypothetical protein
MARVGKWRDAGLREEGIELYAAHQKDEDENCGKIKS